MSGDCHLATRKPYRATSAVVGFSVNAFAMGGICGIKRATKLFPQAPRLLVEVVRCSCYNHIFSVFALHLNTRMALHADCSNAPSRQDLLLPCSRWRGGGLRMSETVQTHVMCDHYRFGTIFDITLPCVLMDSHLLHGTVDWDGDRLLLVAYAADRPDVWSEADSQAQAALGFQRATDGKMISATALLSRGSRALFRRSSHCSELLKR